MSSVALATTTHRKEGGMSDGTDTQVKVQMINKCKVLMTSKRLYKRGGVPMKKGTEKRRNLEQKKRVRTIAFEQRQRYIPYISSDRISNGHEGDFLIFNCCMAQC